MDMDSKKTRVGLIYGGMSNERSISVSSAKHLFAYLSNRYEVIPIGINSKGAWLVGVSPSDFEVDSFSPTSMQFPYLINAQGVGLTRRRKETVNHYLERVLDIDIFFPITHGKYGEDGCIQGLFEMLGIPYVGCSVSASVIGMDKVLTKMVMMSEGIPVVDYSYFTRFEWVNNRTQVLNRIENAVEYPCFVKPARSGSSIGVAMIDSRRALGKGVARAFEYDTKILVEPALGVNEIEIAVVGNEDPFVSLPGEVEHEHSFYDYDAKYLIESTKTIPANISLELSENIQELATRAFAAIGGTGFARVDFFVERRTQQIYLNEINTLPALTSGGMFASLCKHSGISYEQMLNKTIQLGFRASDTRATY